MATIIKQKSLQKINRFFPVYSLENYAANTNSTKLTELKLCYDNKFGKFALISSDYINKNKELFTPRVFMQWPDYPVEVNSTNCPILETLKNKNPLDYWSEQLKLDISHSNE